MLAREYKSTNPTMVAYILINKPPLIPNDYFLTTVKYSCCFCKSTILPFIAELNAILNQTNIPIYRTIDDCLRLASPKKGLLILASLLIHKNSLTDNAITQRSKLSINQFIWATTATSLSQLDHHNNRLYNSSYSLLVAHLSSFGVRNRTIAAEINRLLPDFKNDNESDKNARALVNAVRLTHVSTPHYQTTKSVILSLLTEYSATRLIAERLLPTIIASP